MTNDFQKYFIKKGSQSYDGYSEVLKAWKLRMGVFIKILNNWKRDEAADTSDT